MIKNKYVRIIIQLLGTYCKERNTNKITVLTRNQIIQMTQKKKMHISFENIVPITRKIFNRYINKYN